MSRDFKQGFVIGVVLVTAVFVGLASWKDSGHASELAFWKDRYAQARASVRRDSVEVVRTVTRVKTLRDTLNFHDTIAVREYVQRTDTLQAACLACIASASELATAAETVFVKEAANSRRWYDRVGVSAGYGVLMDRSGAVRHGPVVSASIRIWP